jgi:hypothetical protein
VIFADRVLKISQVSFEAAMFETLTCRQYCQLKCVKKVKVFGAIRESLSSVCTWMGWVSRARIFPKCRRASKETDLFCLVFLCWQLCKQLFSVFDISTAVYEPRRRGVFATYPSRPISRCLSFGGRETGIHFPS